MALAYNPDTNYLFGKGVVLFEKEDETGFLDLGNVPKFELTPEITKEDHYTSRYGKKVKDASITTEVKMTGSLDLEEYSVENLNLLFFGDTPVAGSQTAGALSGTSLTTVADRFVEAGKLNLTWLKVSHGTVTAGPFAAGDTLTCSGVTATVVDVGADYVGCISLAGGVFAVGDTVTAGTTSATVTSVETIEGCLLADHGTVASVTDVYTKGTDYDDIPRSGLVRELTGGTIAAHAAFVYADYPAKTTQAIRPMKVSSVKGVLKFEGNPDVGPRFQVEAWKVEIIPGGAIGLISEGLQAVPLTIDVLDDTANHPNEPFCRITEIS